MVGPLKEAVFASVVKRFVHLFGSSSTYLGVFYFDAIIKQISSIKQPFFKVPAIKRSIFSMIGGDYFSPPRAP